MHDQVLHHSFKWGADVKENLFLISPPFVGGVAMHFPQ